MAALNIETATTAEFANHVVNQSPDIVISENYMEVVESLVRREYPKYTVEDVAMMTFKNTLFRKFDRTVREYHASGVEWVEEKQLGLWASDGSFGVPKHCIDSSGKRKECRTEPIASLQRWARASLEVLSDKADLLRQALREADGRRAKWAKFDEDLGRLILFVSEQGYDPEVTTINEAIKIAEKAEKKDDRGAVHAFHKTKGPVRDLFV